MNKKRVSVIVPVYNVELYIRECLESIISQTYDNLDIILVDDGSTDQSGKICDEYAAFDSRIKVIHKKNGGLVSARKAGVEEAEGEYVVVVDSDDWIEPKEVEYVVSVFEQYDCDMLIMGFIKEYPSFSEIRIPSIPNRYYSQIELESEIGAFLKKQEEFFSPICTVSLCTKAFKKDFYRFYQLRVDEKICIGEDYAVFFPMLKNARSIVVSDHYFYHYRVRNTSIMQSSLYEDMDKLRLLLATTKNIVAEKDNNGIWNQLLFQYSVNYLLLISPNLFLSQDGFVLYPEIKKNERIALYGRGTYGQKLKEVLSQYVIIEDVFDRETINEMVNNQERYQHIVLAITIGKSLKSIIEELIQFGMPKEKILYIKHRDINEINSLNAIINKFYEG